MKKQQRATGTNLTAGLDVSDLRTELVVLDAEGEVIERDSMPTTRLALERRFCGVEPMRVVLEVGPHSPWISRQLRAWGHKVLVANARRVKLISAALDKGDQVDAEVLARLGRADPKLLRPLQHRSEQTHLDLAVMRSRDAMVRSRSLLISHVRGMCKSFGVTIPKCSAECFHKRARAHVPENLAPAVAPVLETIEGLTKQLRAYEKQVEQLSEQKYPETAALREVPGVGLLTGLAYVLVLEDPKRFRGAQSVGPYLGLVPKRRQSGDRDPQLHITKGGDPMLRTLLVQAAHYILGPFAPDSDLRRYGQRICARGGKNAKKRAVVAVARKLSALLYRLWTKQIKTYEPLHDATRRAQRLQRAA